LERLSSFIKGEYRQGDTFLLFNIFPYNFDEKLPLPIGQKVYLDWTPLNILDRAEPKALADYIFPGYNLPMSIPNSCLRIPFSMDSHSTLSTNDLFFLSISALRLFAPIAIGISGQFFLGPEEDLIDTPILYQIKSTWNPKENARYNGKDISNANKICNRLYKLFYERINQNYARLVSAYVLFSQITNGFTLSYQMCFIGLFAALESLFVPKGNKAKTIAARIVKFLDLPDSDKSWLVDKYNHRSYIVHGVQDIKPWSTELNKEKSNIFGKLHEITRLCILGFLSLDDKKLTILSNAKGTELQNELDNLGKAEGEYFSGQRLWLD
jgi:hypothetical protein